MLYSFIENLPFRALFGFFTALILVLSFGSKFIAWAHVHQGLGQPIRTDGPKSHLKTKKGTPTMGGLLILGALLISSLLWINLFNPMVLVTLGVIIIYGLIGLVDDYVKVKRYTPNSMTAKMKLLLQFLASFAAVAVISYYTPANTRYAVNIPYFNIAVDLWLFYVPFAMVVISGASNAVNLTDGLDGLASSLLMIVFLVFAFLAYNMSDNLSIIVMDGEITVICAATIGALMGFMWFNAHPAKIFMGDTGSIALGALLGTIAVMLKSEIVLAIAGGIFVIEALSVMIQVFWYKRTKKRVFLMAPIHHHFEQLGWPETLVVERFQIVTFILAILAMLSIFVG